MFCALYAAENGEIYYDPGMLAVGRNGTKEMRLQLTDMVPLPEGAELMFLPGHSAIAWQRGNIRQLSGNKRAVASILPACYTRTVLPAYNRKPGSAILQLYGYTAVALYKDQIYVAAANTDGNVRLQPFRYNTPDFKNG